MNEEKDLKDYNLYEDTRREMLEIVDKIIAICKKNMPSRWQRVKNWFVSHWRREYTIILIFSTVAVFVLVINFVLVRRAKTILYAKMPKQPQNLSSVESVLTYADKPIVSNINFYRDGDLMVCEVDICKPQVTHNVTASFCTMNGDEISRQDQPAVFNEAKKIRFVIPYNPNIQKVRIYVK
jgi:hypothetical protein